MKLNIFQTVATFEPKVKKTSYDNPRWYSTGVRNDQRLMK